MVTWPKKGGSNFGFSVHKLLRKSIEKMSAFRLAIILMKTGILSYACHYIDEKKEVIERVCPAARINRQVLEATIKGAKLRETGSAVQGPSRDVWRAEGSRWRAERRTTLHVHHQPGGPHFPASVIDSFR